MSDESTTRADVRPPAAPDEADIVAWNRLPRDEQVRRYRAVLAEPACQRVTTDSMAEVLAAARQRVAKSRG